MRKLREVLFVYNKLLAVYDIDASWQVAYVAILSHLLAAKAVYGIGIA